MRADAVNKWLTDHTTAGTETMQSPAVKCEIECNLIIRGMRRTNLLAHFSKCMHADRARRGRTEGRMLHPAQHLT